MAILTFVYNGDGDRYAQTVGGVTTDYVLDPTGLAQVLVETTTGQDMIYLPGMAQYDGSNWQYFAADRLGSTRQLVDPTGALMLGQTFDPFGNVLEQTGPGQSLFGFTGEQTDPTDLVFLRARYYDPGVGRFLTADSMVPDPLRSGGWNRYAYVGNNPINYIDPSGHCIVQYSGEVQMGQAPYGTSGLCPHTESPHSEAAYAATEVANTCYCGSATPDAFLFGWTGGADGFEGFGSSRDFGMEDVINFNNGERTVFHYSGRGSSFGNSAVAAAYAGLIWNLPDNEGYAGSFESLTLTIAAGEGVTISCFWSPDEMPLVGALLPGRTKGLTIGYGVGGGASVSYNQTEFTKIWSSFEQQAP